jgi:fluoride ion exporter CrcB/FEX
VLAREGRTTASIANVVVSVAGSLLALLAGLSLARALGV